MQVHQVVSVLEDIAPTHLAEPWDNVGLLCGDPHGPVDRIMLTIDYTDAVAQEAAAAQCQMVVSYHPPLLKPQRRMLAGTPFATAMRQGVSLYSPHTALDVAAGGTNDVLAQVLGLQDCHPLRVGPAAADAFKLVFFAPPDACDPICTAVFAAGAGRIGAYSQCSFRQRGTGTFRGDASTHPVIGKAERLETVDEVRVEMVLPATAVAAVVAALRQTHPYEEPAFDLVRVAAPPAAVGIGRVGTLPPTSRQELAQRLKQGLNLAALLMAGPMDDMARRVAVCAGAGGDLLDDALRAQADVFVTGEMRHHDALRAARAGMTVLATLHSNSERAALVPFAARLRSQLPGLDVRISREDRDPFVVQ